ALAIASDSPATPYKHWPDPRFKQNSTGKKRKTPAKTTQSGEFQRVPREHSADRYHLRVLIRWKFGGRLFIGWR
ncbi:MAG TPA: hypothetical protein VIJ38_15090, partial [Acidobacteriaceae bacterium]